MMLGIENEDLCLCSNAFISQFINNFFGFMSYVRSDESEGRM
jgi:hypothetical protein